MPFWYPARSATEENETAVAQHPEPPPGGREFTDFCTRIIDDLPLPTPFDEERFLSGLGRQRGKPVSLLVVPARGGLPSGLLLVTANVDIVVRIETSPIHAHHIVAHEVGHLLLDHRSMAQDGESPDDHAVDTLATLLPSLSPTLIRRLLARQLYQDDEERQAEIFASMLMMRAYRAPATRRAAGRITADNAASMTRIENTLLPTFEEKGDR